MLQMHLEPHHVAQMVYEANKAVRNCIIQGEKAFITNDLIFVQISESFRTKLKREAHRIIAKRRVFDLLVERYEGIFVGQTLLVRKQKQYLAE